MKDTVTMSVSPIIGKDGKKCAYVSFEEGARCAEGKIPDCAIISNKGFSQEEIMQLEDYMRKELKNLKKMAAGVNVMRAFMGKQ